MNSGYKFIAVFVVVAVIGIVSKIFFPNIWKWFSIIDTATAVALAFLAGWGYFEYAKSEEPVKIFFDIDGKKVDTGLSLLRRNFTRSEVMGVLGMIQKKQKEKFELQFMKQKAILEKLQKIQTGKDKEFVIKMSQKESEQFIL